MATPSLGTAFSDGARVGSYQNADFNYGVMGALLSPTITYALQPSTKDGVVNNGAIAAAGPLALVSRTTTKFVDFQGYTDVLKLDLCRTLNFNVISGPTPNQIVFTISGWDFWGHKVVETVTIPNASATSFFISSVKTYSYIKSIYASAGSGAAQIGVGTGLGFGFPFYVPHGSMIYTEWGGRPDYSLSAPVGPGLVYINAPHASMRPYTGSLPVLQIGDATDPATATTLDPRGVYYVNDATTFPLDNTWLSIDMYVPGFDASYGTVLSPDIHAPSQSYCYGVTQFSTGWQ